jgi:hypothetical protein
LIYHLLQYWLRGQGHYGYENPLFRGTVAISFSFLVVWLLGPRVIRFLIERLATSPISTTKPREMHSTRPISPRWADADTPGHASTVLLLAD